MNTYLRLLIVPAFVGVGSFVHGQEAEPPRTEGKVLLLKTGHVMEGEIVKVGTQLCVRRGTSEVWVAEDKAIRLCADWDDAYAYAEMQIKRDDAGERVKLARWCHMHRLTDKALEQARKALQLQPGNADAKQLVQSLERGRKDAPAKPAVAIPVVTPRPVEPARTVDVSFETLVAFTSKVQPILMNKCVSCHADLGSSKMNLSRVGDSGRNALTQHNLAAVLDQVDLDRPAISPLLVKALTPHGGEAAAPIRDRSAPALQAMQRWIEQTIAQNPQLKDYREAKKETAKIVSADVKPSTPRPIVRGQSDEPTAPVVQRLETPRPPMPATPSDPHDPEIFNRQAHPQR